jgi:hypothetical protein
MPRAGFFKELQRHHVFRVAATYAVVGWLVIQAVAILFPVLDLPAWLEKIIVVLVLAGVSGRAGRSMGFPDAARRTASVAGHAKAIAADRVRARGRWRIGRTDRGWRLVVAGTGIKIPRIERSRDAIGRCGCAVPAGCRDDRSEFDRHSPVRRTGWRRRRQLSRPRHQRGNPGRAVPHPGPPGHRPHLVVPVRQQQSRRTRDRSRARRPQPAFGECLSRRQATADRCRAR